MEKNFKARAAFITDVVDRGDSGVSGPTAEHIKTFIRAAIEALEVWYGAR